MSKVESCRYGVAIHDVLSEADAAALEAAVSYGKLRVVTQDWAAPLFNAAKRHIHIDEFAAPFGPYGRYLYSGYARWYGTSGFGGVLGETSTACDVDERLYVDKLPSRVRELATRIRCVRDASRPGKPWPRRIAPPRTDRRRRLTNRHHRRRPRAAPRRRP